MSLTFALKKKNFKRKKSHCKNKCDFIKKQIFFFKLLKEFNILTDLFLILERYEICLWIKSKLLSIYFFNESLMYLQEDRKDVRPLKKPNWTLWKWGLVGRELFCFVHWVWGLLVVSGLGCFSKSAAAAV